MGWGGARCNYMNKLISCHNAVVSINNFGIDRLMSQIALQIAKSEPVRVKQ